MSETCNATDAVVCPYDVAISVAEDIAKSHESKDKATALGGIMLTRKALQAVRSRMICPGVVQGTSGQLDCPLRETALSARGMGAGHWHSMQFRIELDQVIEVIKDDGMEDVPTSSSVPGQGVYL